MNKFMWLFNRLRAMSFAEILYRFKKAKNKKANKKKYSNSIKVYDLQNLDIDIRILNKNLQEMFYNNSFKELAETLSLIYNTLGTSYNINDKINWHKGINGEWDRNAFSGDIEFKNTDEIGDIRCSWEINRHQFMPYLAAMYIQTKDTGYLTLLKQHFYDWNAENPFLKGINWSSSMEIAIRAYQWLIVLFILGDTDENKFKEKISKGIINSIKYVMKNLSLYSSANNHLILEAAISSIIGYAFKDVYKQNWFEEGYKILQREIPLQFHSDGVNKEQALHYQAFVTDMMLQYNSIMKNVNKKPICENLIKKSVIFIGVLEPQHSYIDFGDSDDAKIVTLSYAKQNYYDYLIAFASQYYKEDFGSVKKFYNEINLFLEYEQVKDKHSYNAFSTYKEGGYSIINHNSNKVSFDFGELGFGSLAAHGHADALMIIFSKNDTNFLVDAGTYIYNIERHKRDYYRSTDMHNTLCFNSRVQSQILGPFLWGKKAKSELIESYQDESKFYIKAKHDGYKPYIHERSLEYFKSDQLKLIITDYFEKPATINFILDDEVVIEPIDKNIVKLLNNKEYIYLKFDGDYSIELITISKEFTKEVKSKAIRINYDFSEKHRTIITDKLELLN